MRLYEPNCTPNPIFVSNALTYLLSALANGFFLRLAITCVNFSTARFFTKIGLGTSPTAWTRLPQNGWSAVNGTTTRVIPAYKPIDVASVSP